MRKFNLQSGRWDTLRDILVGEPEDFNPDDSTLKGRNYPPMYSNTMETGRLPQVYVNDFRDSVIRYVIWSFGTPIAWRRVADWNVDGTPNYEWVMPGVTYTITTTRHQGKVRAALSQISGVHV